VNLSVLEKDTPTPVQQSRFPRKHGNGHHPARKHDINTLFFRRADQRLRLASANRPPATTVTPGRPLLIDRTIADTLATAYPEKLSATISASGAGLFASLYQNAGQSGIAWE